MLEFVQENLLSNRISHTNVRASLRIMGEDFDVQKITKVLDVSPSETWNKGDSIRNTGKKRMYTAWIYNTKITESLNMDTSTKQIEEVFFPKIDKIVALKKRYHLDISIDFVIVIENEETPAIYFEPDFIQFAAEIGAALDIDTYIN